VTQRVLLVPKGFFGDIVLTSPVFEALKASSRAVHTTVLVPPQFVEFVRRDPHIDDVVVFDRRKEHAGRKGLQALAEVLRARQFDAAYSFHRSPRTSFLLWRSGIAKRVGYADAWLSRLYTARVSKSKAHHEVVRNLELVFDALSPEIQAEVRALTTSGPSLVSDFFSLRVPELAIDEVSATIAGYIDVQQPYVIVAPGSAWETKQWSVKGFREVAAGVVAKGFRVAIVGAPDDSEACGAVASNHQAPEGAIVNLCGRTSLLELIHLIRHAKGVVCNDSLALHLASATRVPTVAVFCATSPLFGFGPWKNRAIVVEKSDLFCKPCRRHGSRTCPTGTRACMEGVSSGQVLAAFDELLCDSGKRRQPSSLHVV
jgi:heptosyltransferase-2